MKTSTKKSVTEFFYVLKVIPINVPYVIGPILFMIKYEVLGYSYTVEYYNDYKSMKAVPYLILFCVRVTFML